MSERKRVAECIKELARTTNRMQALKHALQVDAQAEYHRDKMAERSAAKRASLDLSATLAKFRQGASQICASCGEAQSIMDHMPQPPMTEATALDRERYEMPEGAEHRGPDNCDNWKPCSADVWNLQCDLSDEFRYPYPSTATLVPRTEPGHHHATEAELRCIPPGSKFWSETQKQWRESGDVACMRCSADLHYSCPDAPAEPELVPDAFREIAKARSLEEYLRYED